VEPRVPLTVFIYFTAARHSQLVSAHWFTDGTFVTGNGSHRPFTTSTDSRENCTKCNIRAAGDVELAEKVCGLIGRDRVRLDDKWGFDHGAWSVLRWMYPKAEIPVVQLSIDRTLRVPEHFDLARSLAPLREDKVFIMGSGNVTHNLARFHDADANGDASTPEWAKNFDGRLKEILIARDTNALLELWPVSEDARRSHPMPDHFLPIVYTYAATDARDAVRFPLEGFDGSVSMRSILFG
jgi:4,5-DOPA dioxygenase extradiol